jgi:hypothetical protein
MALARARPFRRARVYPGAVIDRWTRDTCCTNNSHEVVPHYYPLPSSAFARPAQDYRSYGRLVHVRAVGVTIAAVASPYQYPRCIRQAILIGASQRLNFTYLPL